jgi:uncharacterized damage-inducible protein DinB
MLKDAFYGKFSHIDPINALKEITPELARKKVEGIERSCWDLVYHMDYWQDMILRAYDGEESPAKANDKDSWPDQNHVMSDEEWTALVEGFERGLERLSGLAEQDDLSRSSKAWPHSSLLRDMFIMISHNSYHLGQVVQLLRAHQRTE